MYSFYGGQKGQDFRISRIFSNRSEDLLQDLQARWYSPVNVGDYVLVSYGDVTKSNLLITNKQGESVGEKSDYDKNLEIDLLNCGKSYTNSIWQKIYVENDKTVSPDFPDSEENVYIFINFEPNEPIEDPENPKHYTIIDKDGIERKCDKYGNWLNESDQIIRFKQIPGYSLLETSNIYSEENFGFGYRLIACVTGQTPRIQVFHQTINIEDGDPYVTYDLTNPDKPEIKFYLQRSQRIDQVYTDILGPVFSPNAKLLVDKEEIREINGEKVRPSLTKPILELQIPRAAKYFSGLLFGAGSLSDVPFNYTDLNGDIFTNITYTQRLDEINKTTLLSTLLNDAIKEDSTVGAFKDTVSSSIDEKAVLKGYYFKDESLLSYLRGVQQEDGTWLGNESVTEDSLPWGCYGLDKKYYDKNKNDIDLKKYCLNIGNELATREETLNSYLGLKETSLEKSPIEIIEESYCGNYGFIDKSLFDLFDEQEKKRYCFDYLKGFSSTNDLYLIASFFRDQTPIVDIRNFILEVNRRDSADNLPGSKDELDYIKKILSQMYYLQYHFELVSLRALPGDIYIHTPSGRLYQFKSVTGEELKVNYIGTLLAPAPEVESKIISAFVRDGGTGYVKNNLSVQTNKIINDANSTYREKFIFSIPETPNFEASVAKGENRAEAIVERKIKNENTVSFNFTLPKEVNFFTASDLLKGSEFDGKTPVLKDGLSLDENDFYIHTTDNLNDPYRGWIYMYKNKRWEKQGSLLGPIGIPTPIITISLYAYSGNEGISKKTDTPNSFYINDNSLNDMAGIVDQIYKDFPTITKPESSKGQIAIIKVYIKNGSLPYEESSNYWAQDNNGTWYLTLISATGSFMTSEKITGEDANNITYTAAYINSLPHPEWDTSYF